MCQSIQSQRSLFTNSLWHQSEFYLGVLKRLKPKFVSKFCGSPALPFPLLPLLPIPTRKWPLVPVGQGLCGPRSGRVAKSKLYTSGDKDAGTNWIGGCVDPRPGLDVWRKADSLRRGEISAGRVQLKCDGTR